MSDHQAFGGIARAICYHFQHHPERGYRSHPMAYQRHTIFPLDSLNRMINKMFWESGHPLTVNYFYPDIFFRLFNKFLGLIIK
jgi:hypothetical protein